MTRSQLPVPKGSRAQRDSQGEYWRSGRAQRLQRSRIDLWCQGSRQVRYKEAIGAAGITAGFDGRLKSTGYAGAINPVRCCSS